MITDIIFCAKEKGQIWYAKIVKCHFPPLKNVTHSRLFLFSFIFRKKLSLSYYNVYIFVAD